MDSTFIRDLTLGIVRHLIAGAGAALVADGVLMQSQTNDFTGSVLFLMGVGFSVWDKWRKLQAARTAAITPQGSKS